MIFILGSTIQTSLMGREENPYGVVGRVDEEGE